MQFINETEFVDWHKVSLDLTEKLGEMKGIISGYVKLARVLDNDELLKVMKEFLSDQGDMCKFVADTINKHTENVSAVSKRQN